MSLDGEDGAVEGYVGIQRLSHADSGDDVVAERHAVEFRSAVSQGGEQDGALGVAFGSGQCGFSPQLEGTFRQQVGHTRLAGSRGSIPCRRDEKERSAFFQGLEARVASERTHGEGQQPARLEAVVQGKDRRCIFRAGGRGDDLHDVSSFPQGLGGYLPQPRKRLGIRVVVPGKDDPGPVVQGQVQQPLLGVFREIERDVHVIRAREDGCGELFGSLCNLGGQGNVAGGDQFGIPLAGENVPDFVRIEVTLVEPDLHGGSGPGGGQELAPVCSGVFQAVTDSSHSLAFPMAVGST